MKKIVFDFYGVIYDPEVKAINEGVLNIIKSLSQRGFALYIFTNSPKKSIEKKNEETSFLEYFEGVIHDPLFLKPHSKSFENLLRILDCDSSNIVLIDDREEIVKKAMEFGIEAIKYTNAESLEKELN